MGDIITDTQAKSYLGVSGSADDTLIAHFNDAAKAALESAVYRNLTSTTITEILHGTGKRSLWLKEPAESVTSLHESSDQTWDSTTLVDADDYNLRNNEVIKLAGTWTEGVRNFRAVYLGGFATIPDDIVQAQYKQIAWMYSQWQRDKKGLNIIDTHRIEQWSQRFLPSRGLDPEAAVLIRPYMNPGL